MVEINEGGMEDIGSHKNHRELFKPFQSSHSSTFKFYIFIPKSNYLKGSFEWLCLVIHNDKLVESNLWKFVQISQDIFTMATKKES